MKTVLSDTESHLNAFVFQRSDLRQVPHSAFHSLEATHMKTILSQMNDSQWYKTFITLDPVEYSTLDRLLHPLVMEKGKFLEREVVVLKILQHNRCNAWMSLVTEFILNRPFTHESARVILAITREKLIDGDPLPFAPRCRPPPPPPPGWTGVVRPPPMPSVTFPNRISE